MTSINAIKFDFWRGAMVCDEQRHWNSERMKVFAADKIRPVVTREIRNACRFLAAYGNTGTSTIGDELRFSIARLVQDKYREFVRKSSCPLTSFLTMDELAEAVFNTMIKVKHNHVNEELQAKYGITTSDFISGKIMNQEIIEDAYSKIAWKPPEGSNPVFGNSGILSGFDPEGGFKIFVYSMRETYYAPVEAGFVCLGSGSDSANPVMAHFFINSTLKQREKIDPVDGLIAIISSVNAASRNNLGVGGYFNILLFDGEATAPDDNLREINDHRSKIASEICLGLKSGFIQMESAREMIHELFFGSQDADKVQNMLWQNTKEPLTFHRFLRGFRTGGNFDHEYFL